MSNEAPMNERMIGGLVDGKLCGRRIESGFDAAVFTKVQGDDRFRDDNTCSYCGSFNPDELMKRLEAGTVELGPTDKSYKIYLENKGGEPFAMSCPKFYFQHFSKAQMIRFIELLNEKKLKIGMPGRFYVKPYFIA